MNLIYKWLSALVLGWQRARVSVEPHEIQINIKTYRFNINFREITQCVPFVLQVTLIPY